MRAACIWVSTASSRCGTMDSRSTIFESGFEFELKSCGSHAPFQVANLVEARCVIAQFILEPVGHIGGSGCVTLQRRE